MLPERLSTDLTSLNPQQDRLAVVIEFVATADGELASSDVYGALVRNHAKLAYNAVGAWLAGTGPLPPAAAAVPGMDEQLRMQDGVAQALRAAAHEHGALEFRDDRSRARLRRRHAARRASRRRRIAPRQLIENLMVAANGVTARFLDAHGFPSLRRVVRSPERWDRIGRCRARARRSSCRPRPTPRR